MSNTSEHKFSVSRNISLPFSRTELKIYNTYKQNNTNGKTYGYNMIGGVNDEELQEFVQIVNDSKQRLYYREIHDFLFRVIDMITDRKEKERYIDMIIIKFKNELSEFEKMYADGSILWSDLQIRIAQLKQFPWEKICSFSPKYNVEHFKVLIVIAKIDPLFSCDINELARMIIMEINRDIKREMIELLEELIISLRDTIKSSRPTQARMFNADLVAINSFMDTYARPFMLESIIESTAFLFHDDKHSLDDNLIHIILRQTIPEYMTAYVFDPIRLPQITRRIHDTAELFTRIFRDQKERENVATNLSEEPATEEPSGSAF